MTGVEDIYIFIFIRYLRFKVQSVVNALIQHAEKDCLTVFSLSYVMSKRMSNANFSLAYNKIALLCRFIVFISR